MAIPVEQHFDNIAAKYDYFKKKIWYYYKNLKQLYKQLIPKQKTVLEIGCGTGDLILEIDASQALGIDISREMIKIAQQKYPHIKFEAIAIENFKTEHVIDFIFLADVIEHLEDVSGTVKSIAAISNKETIIIISYANPRWEPVLIFLEEVGLKMPEGVRR